MQYVYLMPLDSVIWLYYHVNISMGNYYISVVSLTSVFKKVITKLKLKVDIAKYKLSYANAK